MPGTYNAKPMSSSNAFEVSPDMLKGWSGKFKKIAIAVVIIILFFNVVKVIEAGNVGVVSLFGRVSDRALTPGINFVLPLSSVHRFSTRTQEYTMSSVADEGAKQGNDSIAVRTKEGLDMTLDITVLYRVNETSAPEIYKTIGTLYEDKIIRTIVRSVIREVVANYDAKEVYSSKRIEVNDQISDNIKSKIEPRGFILENVLLRDVKLPANLSQTIQEKLQAEQEAQKYEFILQKEHKEAERKIIEAEGQRDAQKIINESLSANYLYYQYINQLKDRQGTIYVPTNPANGLPTFKGVN